jgi:flagellar P-ring protein precursor FlgI
MSEKKINTVKSFAVVAVLLACSATKLLAQQPGGAAQQPAPIVSPNAAPMQNPGSSQNPPFGPGGVQPIPQLNPGLGQLPAPPANGINTNFGAPPRMQNPAAMGGPQSLQEILPTQPRKIALDPSVRIKDITYIHGNRVNNLSGQGLVVGLNGTGGRSEQTRRTATNFYLRQGQQLLRADTTNMSAVLVSAKVPAYATKGETILVTVSVADDASSLYGGTLNQTALRGIDDEIYAIAQGPIIGGGLSAQGDAASVSVNHPTVGVCEAILEREIPCENILREGRFLRLVLLNKSYSTVTLIANALNQAFPNSRNEPEHARAVNMGVVEVRVPDAFLKDIPAFISIIGDLRVRPDKPAEVVINQKTGTIIAGAHVKISSVVFASENIVIATNETPVASQPAPFSQGQTAILPRTTLDIYGSGGTYNVLNDGLSVGDLANALNILGVSPNTLINIMTSLRNNGALQAKLTIE